MLTPEQEDENNEIKRRILHAMHRHAAEGQADFDLVRPQLTVLRTIFRRFLDDTNGNPSRSIEPFYRWLERPEHALMDVKWCEALGQIKSYPVIPDELRHTDYVEVYHVFLPEDEEWMWEHRHTEHGR